MNTDNQFQPNQSVSTHSLPTRTSAGWSAEQMGSQAGKTFVITGTTSGTGFEATKMFLSKGARVVMLNRNPEKSDAVVNEFKQLLGDDIRVINIQMDLGDLRSVRRAASEVLKQVPTIDALICNAAIAQVADLRKTIDGFESQFGVNHLGHFLLCGLLFKQIEAAKGRIVIVGSLGYKMGLKRIQFEDINFEKNYSGWNAYSQSKLAQMMFGYELQRRLKTKGSPVEVHICHPGASRTNLIQNSAGFLQRIFWATVAPFIAQSAEQGAWPELMCATEQGLTQKQLYGPMNRGLTVGPVVPSPVEPLALDVEAATMLWEISEAKTGFKWSL